MKKVVVAMALAVFCSGAAYSGTIERACLGSERSAGNRALCGCIQKVANTTLDANDQRMAAGFFKNPHMAQEIRQSDNVRHAIFWKKYKLFGSVAQASCS